MNARTLRTTYTNNNIHDINNNIADCWLVGIKEHLKSKKNIGIEQEQENRTGK